MRRRRKFSNEEIARLLDEVKAAYIILNENKFRIRAYENVANIIRKLEDEVYFLWQKKQLEKIPGIGKQISAHLDELFKKGKVSQFQDLFKKIPPSVFSFISLAGVGPKTAYKLAINLKIKKRANCLLRLEKACLQKKVRKIKGFGVEKEKEILLALKKRRKKEKRTLLPYAWKLAYEFIKYLKNEKTITNVFLLGSLRRKLATIGDIDIAICTKKPKKALVYALNYPLKTKVIEQGEKKASLIVKKLQVDIRFGVYNQMGTLRQYFTGSKMHNIKLREFALKKGYSLSEYGIKNIKNKKILTFVSEKKLYNFLGLKWIPPELREGKEEIEYSVKNKLPILLKLKDIKGDLHLHSNFPIEPSHDLGEDEIVSFCKKALELGYQYLAFTEHNPSINNHSEKQIFSILKRKKVFLDKLNYSFNKNTQKKLYIFNGLEVDIKPNGELALPEKCFSLLDFIIASIHSSFKLDKERMTKRLILGLSNPKVKILAHPSCRLLNKREMIAVDWEKIFIFCLKNNKFLEVNAQPDRTDLPDFLIKKALTKGVKLSIGSDSHQVKDMNNLKFAVFNLRRGWATKNDVINALSYDKIKKILIS